MHKSVIEAADCANTRYSPKETARRVLRAQAKPEAISDETCRVALTAMALPIDPFSEAMMLSGLEAALERMAKEVE